MKKYNSQIKEVVLDNGLKVILVSKPGYHKSLFMCSSAAGGFTLKQFVNDQMIVHPSGCAHFLEHQMFHYHDSDAMQLFAKMQASSNAYTSYTETAYYFSTSADIKEPIELLLDFVMNLDINEKTVEKEKGIILSEYDMYAQNPESRLLKETWKSLYHMHPMNIDVLGSREDIQNMRVQDLSRFYQINYDPSNMVLVGITGKDLDLVLEDIVNANKRPSIYPVIKTIIDDEPENVVREHFETQMDVSIPYVCVAYKLKGIADRKQATLVDTALQMCTDSLFGPLNPLYQSWIDARLFTNMFGAECHFGIDHGYLLVYAQSEDPEHFIEIVDENIRSLHATLISKANFDVLKKRYRAMNIRSLDRFEHLASELVHSALEHDSYWDVMETMDSITYDQLSDLISTLDFSNRTITMIKPKSSNMNDLG